MKFWESLEEMPVWNWQKVLETSDHHYLLREPEGGKDADILADLEKLWRKLQDAFIDRFGLSKRYVSIERKRLGVERLQLKYMSSGDKSLLPVIEVRKRELEAMIREQKQEKKQPFEEQVVLLETHLGFFIDTRKVSVSRYYTYIQVYERELESLTQKGNVK